MNGALTDDEIIEHLRENDFIAEVYEFKKQYLKYRRKEAKDGGDAVRG